MIKLAAFLTVLGFTASAVAAEAPSRPAYLLELQEVSALPDSVTQPNCRGVRVEAPAPLQGGMVAGCLVELAACDPRVVLLATLGGVLIYVRLQDLMKPHTNAVSALPWAREMRQVETGFWFTLGSVVVARYEQLLMSVRKAGAKRKTVAAAESTPASPDPDDLNGDEDPKKRSGRKDLPQDQKALHRRLTRDIPQARVEARQTLQRLEGVLDEPELQAHRRILERILRDGERALKSLKRLDAQNRALDSELRSLRGFEVNLRLRVQQNPAFSNTLQTIRKELAMRSMPERVKGDFLTRAYKSVLPEDLGPILRTVRQYPRTLDAFRMRIEEAIDLATKEGATRKALEEAVWKIRDVTRLEKIGRALERGMNPQRILELIREKGWL